MKPQEWEGVRADDVPPLTELVQIARVGNSTFYYDPSSGFMYRRWNHTNSTIDRWWRHVRT